MNTEIAPVVSNTLQLSSATKAAQHRSRSIDDLPLPHDQFAGNFSLTGNGAMIIAAAPGLIVRVYSGSLLIRQRGNVTDRLVHEGQIAVSDRAQPMEIFPVTRAELRLEWPSA